MSDELKLPRSRMATAMYENQKEKYSPEKIKDVLNEALKAIHYWREEYKALEKQVAYLAEELRLEKKKMIALPIMDIENDRI